MVYMIFSNTIYHNQYLNSRSFWSWGQEYISIIENLDKEDGVKQH